MRKRGGRREKFFARRDDNESTVAQRALVLRFLAVVTSTNRHKPKDFLSRELDAAVNVRRCVALKTRREELTQANFVGQPLRVDV